METISKLLPHVWKVLRLPPFIWLGLALLAYFVRFLFPTPRIVPEPLQNIGPAIFMIGLGLILAAAYKFFQKRTNIEAFRDPNHLITDGVYSYTRNPIYLGFAIMLFGLCWYWNTLYGLVSPVIFLIISNYYFVAQEEQAASRVFGDAYAVYKKKVRRWI